MKVEKIKTWMYQMDITNDSDDMNETSLCKVVNDYLDEWAIAAEDVIDIKVNTTHIYTNVTDFASSVVRVLITVIYKELEEIG